MLVFPLPFFFTDPATTQIYTLSLHDALPILCELSRSPCRSPTSSRYYPFVLHYEPSLASSSEALSLSSIKLATRSEEHTSELQSQSNLVCRLLLEKKKKKKNQYNLRLSIGDY